MLTQHPELRVVHCDHVIGDAASKNIGLMQSRGRNIVVLDGSAEITGNILDSVSLTLDDPTVWTRPWTGMFRWDLDDSQYELVEYSCHEGNYGMTNILSGARARDAEAAAQEGR